MALPYLDGSDLIGSIGKWSNVDLRATSVFEPEKRYLIIVEFSESKQITFWVAEKREEEKYDFGDPKATRTSDYDYGIHTDSWTDGSNAVWGGVSGGAQGLVYGAWPGQIHKGAFYDGKTFDDIWTRETELTFAVRQVDNSLNIGTVTEHIQITFDAIPPTFTSGDSTTPLNGNDNQLVYTIQGTDNLPSVVYKLGTAGGDENQFQADEQSGRVTYTGGGIDKEIYSIEVIVMDTAGNTVGKTLTVNNPVFSADTKLQNEISLYPNPSSGEITINLGKVFSDVQSIKGVLVTR